ncbi:hypothetical protein BS50DRAFT_361107 [Corynespora cassiicola Philippines]|uniref:Uncharacterized protein n=1 Tax=Corynespora cassiicola Philippines TaxID=1448308 RepID=A0A2T2NSA6_CORCC|nr:hypothetical protein BS50DRAFT_361107 [Corynespora cassiicola Philippines]
MVMGHVSASSSTAPTSPYQHPAQIYIHKACRPKRADFCTRSPGSQIQTQYSAQAMHHTHTYTRKQTISHPQHFKEPEHVTSKQMTSSLTPHGNHARTQAYLISTHLLTSGNPPIPPSPLHSFRLPFSVQARGCIANPPREFKADVRTDEGHISVGSCHHIHPCHAMPCTQPRLQARILISLDPAGQVTPTLESRPTKPRISKTARIDKGHERAKRWHNGAVNLIVPPIIIISSITIFRG